MFRGGASLGVSKLDDEAVITIRVPRDLKERVATIARELRISQSAVWKILIAKQIRGSLTSDLQADLAQATVSQIQRNPDERPPQSRRLRP